MAQDVLDFGELGTLVQEGCGLVVPEVMGRGRDPSKFAVLADDIPDGLLTHGVVASRGARLTTSGVVSQEEGLEPVSPGLEIHADCRHRVRIEEDGSLLLALASDEGLQGVPVGDTSPGEGGNLGTTHASRVEDTQDRAIPQEFKAGAL